MQTRQTQRIDRLCEEVDEAGKKQEMEKSAGMRKDQWQEQDEDLNAGSSNHQTKHQTQSKEWDEYMKHTFPRGASTTTWTTTQKREHARAITTRFGAFLKTIQYSEKRQNNGARSVRNEVVENHH